MAFHFRLESILRLRRGQERAERLKLESITSELGQTRARLVQAVEGSLTSRRRFQQELIRGLAGSELTLQATTQSNTASRRAALQSLLSQLEQSRRTQLEIYYKFRQRREILENLRVRKLEAYVLGQTRHEQQELDDLFLMRVEIARRESN